VLIYWTSLSFQRVGFFGLVLVLNGLFYWASSSR